jgi:hypothetical protein
MYADYMVPGSDYTYKDRMDAMQESKIQKKIIDRVTEVVQYIVLYKIYRNERTSFSIFSRGYVS